MEVLFHVSLAFAFAACDEIDINGADILITSAEAGLADSDRTQVLG